MAGCTHRQIAIFRSCFSGLKHAYGTYDRRSGRTYQIKQPVTDRVIADHLLGVQPYGVYLLVGNRTRAAVVDFDQDDTEPPLAFISQAQRYGIASYLEHSKRKGWHVWIFAEPAGVMASKIRAVVKLILHEVGIPSTELFPKQDRLGPGLQYGNFINAPLYGQLVDRGRTVFVDPEQGLTPVANQWEYLDQVRRVCREYLDEIIDLNDLHPGDTRPVSGFKMSVSKRRSYATYGLLPCAQRMLAEGVSTNQRVACFRLAIALKKAGLPLDMSIACLQAWARKNTPENNKRIITGAEIVQQTQSAYGRPYRGCGCESPAVEPFCEPECPLHKSVKGNR